MTNKSTTVDDNLLNAALMAPEDDVAEPSSKRPWSFASQVSKLEVGGVACRLLKLEGEKTLNEIGESLTELRRQCRNNATPSVKRAAAQTGGEYSIEVCDFVTPRGMFYVATIVTRTA